MSAIAAYENVSDASVATLFTKRVVTNEAAETKKRGTKAEVNKGAFTIGQMREMLKRKCNTPPPC